MYVNLKGGPLDTTGICPQLPVISYINKELKENRAGILIKLVVNTQ